MNRYVRQQILPQVGPAGQRKIREAHVLVVGAGALGCASLPYLCGAGVGRLTVVDGDVVERSNLHRQTLFGEASIGRFKALAACDVLSDLNPEVQIVPITQPVNPSNATALVNAADVVLDCADSFALTYLLSDVCLERARPYISASVRGFTGYAGGFCGKAPSVRAVFPELPSDFGTCATDGVMGPVAGMFGMLQAQMALSVLLDLSPSPLGQLVTMDLVPYLFRSFRFDEAPEPTSPPIPFVATAGLSDQDLIIELRTEQEAPIPVHPRALRIPSPTFDHTRLTPLPEQRVVLCCRSGVRAWRAAKVLRVYWNGPIALLATGANPEPIAGRSQ
ncbi:MAG: HesA/MoeB/ThiF family protein [Pyrinomonadaceae bacterium]|nr:HesA/MoeB/ThiF family protein [Phycisphaerales bacterium]